MAKFDVERDLENLQSLRTLLDELSGMWTEFLRTEQWSDKQWADKLAARFDETRREATRLLGRLSHRLETIVMSAYGERVEAFPELLNRSLQQRGVVHAQMGGRASPLFLPCLDAAKYALDVAIGRAEGELSQLGHVSAQEYLRVRWLVRLLLCIWDAGAWISRIVLAQPGRWWWERFPKSWVWQLSSVVVAVLGALGAVVGVLAWLG